MLSLELVGEPSFVGPTWKTVWREKSFVFTWIWDTVCPNVLFWKLLNVRPFRWPPWIYVEAFIPKEG